MNPSPPDPKPTHDSPQFESLGTTEYDCLADLPADSPVRTWPVLDAFPRFEFLGTTESDGASGRPRHDPDLTGSLAPPQAADELGRLGRYRIVKLLGQGGMGTVFAADDPTLGRRVAIKVMRPEAAAHPEAKSRFLREARAAGTLQHDHVVPIYDVAEEGGVPYIVMPLLAGESLASRLRREPRLPVEEVVRIGRQAAEGLAAAHAAGLIHRDIKPANLWLEGEPGGVTPKVRLKILDFGLAQPLSADTGLTPTGAVLGTPAYMAPEQANGAADSRSDLFSLGCVLYRCATGEPPFEGPTLTAVLRAVAEHHPPPPRDRRPELPAALSFLIERLLAKDPDRRPASAREVADTLRAIEPAGEGELLPSPTTAVSPASSPQRARRSWTDRWSITLTITLAVLLTAAAMFLGGYWRKPPLRGSLDVRVWPKGEAHHPGRRLPEQGVLPLRPGDLLRIESELSRPAYQYLVWLSADGKATPLWPWVNNDWRNRPADRDQPRQALSIPETASQSAPLDPGPSGVEALLLLARETPLPADEDLSQRFVGLPKQQGLDPLRMRLAVWFENGEPVRDEPERSPINLGQTQTVEDPVWRTRALLRDELRPLFPYTRAVCFTFQGQ
jgi:serine/threonine protein kinase